jgi:hypothetical protein
VRAFLATALALAAACWGGASGANAQQPALLHAEAILVGAADPVPLAALGLGDGGLAGRRPDGLRWTATGCMTRGGVQVSCQPVGVKLEFPSGCEVLLAADGVLHLRSGESAGPFPFGVELQLADGTAVRVLLAQAQKDRLREVAVVDGETMAFPWQRGLRAKTIGSVRPWGGVRLACCGDGGDVYRLIALGPVLTCERVLAAKSRAGLLPERRLVVLTAPLLASLAHMPRQHTSGEEAMLAAMRAVRAVTQLGHEILPDGLLLRRVDGAGLRWALPRDFDLGLALDGPLAPRLMLFAGRTERAMVEWTLAGNPAAFLANPFDAQPGAARWHGNGTRLPRVVPEWQCRAELHEYGRVLGLLRHLLDGPER